jgi:hypothetical protein
MKQRNYTKRVIIIAFLLSLLFHASSVLYVVIQKKQQSNPDSLQEKEETLKQKLKKQEEWAEAKARANNFGAPVMFEDLPDEETENTTENTAKDTDKNESDLEATKETEQEIIKEVIPEKVAPPEKSTSLETPTKAPFANVQQTKNMQPPQQNKPVQKKQPTKKKKPILGPKPPLSLAQLTQGFLNHVKDEGKNAVHMLGKKNGVPSDEQIKYERYLQKLSWCLQNSFNINNNRVPQTMTTESTVYVLLALNKDGSLKQCNVTKTSGDPQIDKFTLFIFNDASTSFPPVPKYLPHDPFTITYIITHNTREENGMRLYRR